MTAKPRPGAYAESCAIPFNRSKEEGLSPEVRDLAELLADIVVRRLQAGLAKHPIQKETEGVS